LTNPPRLLILSGMNVELTVSQSFDAAHRLSSSAAPEKCKRTHGHRYTVEITCAGAVNPKTGMLVSYDEMESALGAAVSTVDHSTLNDAIPEAGEPTTENLCRWFWMHLHRYGGLNLLSRIRIWETANSHCTFRGGK
jgi:6-pyruvoyltetrahydropterin/6-carboxytetrahydropterin synthase